MTSLLTTCCNTSTANTLLPHLHYVIYKQWFLLWKIIKGNMIYLASFAEGYLYMGLPSTSKICSWSIVVCICFFKITGCANRLARDIILRAVLLCCTIV